MTDLVELLDAMFTDDEDHGDDRLLITVYAADEITRLRQELADAKTLLADALPRIVDGIRLRAENAKLREIIAEWEDATYHYGSLLDSDPRQRAAAASLRKAIGR